MPAVGRAARGLRLCRDSASLFVSIRSLCVTRHVLLGVLLVAISQRGADRYITLLWKECKSSA